MIDVRRAVLIAAHARRRAQPDPAAPVLSDGEHGAARQSVARAEGTEHALVVDGGAGRQQPDPDAALAVGVDRLTGPVRRCRLASSKRDTVLPSHVITPLSAVQSHNVSCESVVSAITRLVRIDVGDRRCPRTVLPASRPIFCAPATHSAPCRSVCSAIVCDTP